MVFLRHGGAVSVPTESRRRGGFSNIAPFIRRGDSAIKLLCGAGLFHPPSKSTIRSPALQSDPRCAVRGFHLGDHPVLQWSGRGKWCADCHSLLPIDQNRGGFGFSAGSAFGFLGWREGFKSSFLGQELPGDAGHASGGGEDGGVGFFAQRAFTFVVLGEIGRAAYRDPSGFDKSPTQPFVAPRHEAALVGLASAAGGGGAEAGVAAELLRARKALDAVDFTHDNGGEDGAHAGEALDEGEFGRVFEHGFEGGLVLGDAGLEIAQHFELLLEQESGGRGEVEFIQEPEAAFAEEVAALGELEVVLGAEEAVDAVADHGALAHEEAALAQHFLSLAGGFGGDVNLADHSGMQEPGEDVGIDLIVFNLGLGDDPGLEGVGQNDVLFDDMGLEDFVEPGPVHGGFENHTGFGIALGQLDEEFRGGVLDTTALKDAAFGVKDAKNAVSLMEVDSDRDWIVVGCGWFGHKTAHPTTSVLSASRCRYARRSRRNQAFMSSDPISLPFLNSDILPERIAACPFLLYKQDDALG